MSPDRPLRRQTTFVTAGGLLLLAVVAVACALFVSHFTKVTNSTLQQRVLSIAAQLRAPGDHNSMTVATSSLTTAQHMRYEIQQYLLAGKTRGQILQLMVAHYGARVLAAPAFGGVGRVFWVIPWLALASLGAVGAELLRRGLRRGPTGPLEERAHQLPSDDDIDDETRRLIDAHLQEYY